MSLYGIKIIVIAYGTCTQNSTIITPKNYNDKYVHDYNIIYYA